MGITPRWASPNDPYAEDIPVGAAISEIPHQRRHRLWCLAGRYWKATGDDAWMRDCGGRINSRHGSVLAQSCGMEYTKQERYEIRMR
jgi:kojibiose phosphorylase